jgi:hypothetical protein
MPLRKQKIIVIISLVLLATAPHFVSAAGLVPCGSNRQSPCTVLDIFTLVAQVTNWLIAVAGIYAVYKIIEAGFWLTVSLGNEESITRRKTEIQNAIIGFVLVMFAYMFINTAVNAILVNEIPGCQINLQKPLAYLQINPSNCKSGQ